MPDDPLRASEQVVFVKGGFMVLALVFPLLWIVLNSLWLVLAGYVVASIAIQLGANALGFSEQIAGIAALGINIILGFQGGDLKRWTLERRGYREVGIVTGRTAQECELKFFRYWLKSFARRNLPAPAPA